MKPYILPLDSSMKASNAEAGGKGAGLSWLAVRGFRTAPGFIITTAAFREFIRSSGVDPDVLTTDTDRSQAILSGTSLPRGVEEPILEAYKILSGRVAVRSSMVGEDGREFSLAGQLDTLLNVKGEEALIRAIRSCWTSMLNPRLMAYLREREANNHIAMAIVVQRMVEAKAAGVAFSADPITGEDRVVIEAATGLGDAVAGGTVDPDRWVVDSHHRVVDIIHHSPEAPALDKRQVIELAGLIHRIAKAAGSPQDVEWAWDGSGFIFLQVRPITTLSNKDVYSSKFVSEMVPGLIKPLVWSTTTSAITQNVFKHVFDELLGEGSVDASKLVRRIHSRLYANVTLLGRACEQLGLPANFFETITRGERPTNVRESFLSFHNLPEKFRLLRFVLRNSRAAHPIKAFIDKQHRELEPLRRADWDAKSIDDLLASLDLLRAYHGEVQWTIFITALNMSVRNRMLGRLVQRVAPDVAVGDLLGGNSPSQALGANHALQRMAIHARRLDGNTQSLLINGNDSVIRNTLSMSDAGKSLIRLMNDFQARYGFLSANGTDFSLPAWRETPDLLWQMIGRLVKQPPPLSKDRSERRRKAMERVSSALSPIRRMRFKRLLASTVLYMELRERVSQLVSEDAHLLRRIYLAIADRLIAQNLLKQRDNIFLLDHEEVIRLTQGEIKAEEVARLIEMRQAELERDALFDPPEIVRGEGSSTVVRASIENEAEFLTGISGSAGVMEGRARIVRDPSVAPQDLCRDDILVVPFTDVGWTPLLAGIGGIVAETGGQLSHTAIVAREYGLPAVVSVKRATQRVREGQRIVVDGGQGRVYLK